MNQDEIVSIIINTINYHVKNFMGIILSTNINFKNDILTINYNGTFRNPDKNNMVNYFQNNFNGIIIIIDDNYLRFNLLNLRFSLKKLELTIQIESLNNYIFYPNLIAPDLLAEICSNLDKKTDIIKSDFCNDSTFNGFLIYKNYPDVADLIKKVEQIDSTTYSQYYKDLYFLIIDKGLNILTSTNNVRVLTDNQLTYRLMFYINYPGSYNKINKYLNNKFFLEIMTMYTFPYLGTNNIYSVYSLTGNIYIDYCENKNNYMEIEDNLKFVTECIEITNSKLSKFQKAIIPWIGINDILTFFMIMDLKQEIHTSEEINLLRGLLINKYKGSKYLENLLNIFNAN